MFVFSPAPSNVWADLRVGRVIAFRCGLISGLHHELEVIGPERASRDFPAFDATFPGFCRHAFLANSCWDQLGWAKCSDPAKFETPRERNFSLTANESSAPEEQECGSCWLRYSWTQGSTLHLELEGACEPGMYYFSISSPTMRRSQPKYIEEVDRKIVIF